MRFLDVSRTVLALAFLLCGCQTHQTGADEPRKSAPPKGSGAFAISGEFSYAGKASLTRSTNRLVVADILDLPESVELRRVTLDKLAVFVETIISPAKTNAEIVRLIRPLLDDALDAPSHAEGVQFSPRESAQWFYGFHLSEDRAQLWQTNLWKAGNLAASGAFRKIHSDSFAGWKLSLTNGDNLAFAKIDSWIVVTIGKHLPGKEVAFLANLAKGDTYLEKTDRIAEFRLKRGASWIDKGFLKDEKVSELDFSLQPQRGTLRSELKVTLDKGHQWTLEPWRIPTNTIREPLIAFTAIQSLSNWFANQKPVQKLQLQPAPNQVFLWAQSHLIFPLYAAAHVPGNSNVLERFSKTVLPEWSTNLVKEYGGEVQWVTNLCGAFWHGMPAMVPFIRPGAEADGDVIVAGLLPVDDSNSPPAPSELIGQVVGRTNLLFYDWEVSTPRLSQMNQLGRMISALQFRMPREPNRPTEKWLEAISPKLQNTITEATLISPEEISIVRRSVTGLSSVELVALARWVEHPAFPRMTPDFWLEPKLNRPPDRR